MARTAGAARSSAGAVSARSIGARLLSLDDRLLTLARTRGHTPAAERAMARFSQLGEHGAVWLAIGAAGQLLDPGRRRRWRAAMTAVGGAYVLNTAIKPLAGRRRPKLEGLPPLTSTPTQLSFPSAHATTSFAGALVYSRLGLPAAPLYALAVALSFSRVYLGVHHPGDVLAGALLGTAVGGLASRGWAASASLGEPGTGGERAG